MSLEGEEGECTGRMGGGEDGLQEWSWADCVRRDWVVQVQGVEYQGEEEEAGGAGQGQGGAARVRARVGQGQGDGFPPGPSALLEPSHAKTGGGRKRKRGARGKSRETGGLQGQRRGGVEGSLPGNEDPVDPRAAGGMSRAAYDEAV